VASRLGRPAARRAARLLGYALAAGLFSVAYRAATHEYRFATPAQLAAFTAHTPYQYRVLVPALARAAHELAGVEVETSYRVLAGLAAFALLVSFRVYLGRFVPEAWASWGALSVFYALLWNVSPVSSFRFLYPSDVPAVAFMTLGLEALVRRRLALFYPIFALASLNRETSCLLSFAYLFTAAGEQRARTLGLHLGLQLALWSAIKAALALAFAGNDGGFLDPMAARNAALLRSLLELRPGPTSLALLTPCGMLWLLLPFGFRAQPRFLRRALLVLLPFYLGMGAVANLDELRIYGELAPILAAPAVASAWRLATRSARG